MNDIIVWGVHTPAGSVALIAAIISMYATKGSGQHRKAGHYFVISMHLMLMSGFAVAVIKESFADMLLAAVVLYMVFTAWVAAYHRNSKPDFLEYIALAWIALFATIAGLLAATTTNSELSIAAATWAIFATLCAIGDLRNILVGGLMGKQRVVRHVWRIGFSLVWSALAFTDKIVKMLGSDVKEMPFENVLFIVGMPTLFILLIILYWIIHVLFLSSERYTLGSSPNKL